jgi:hypothetical protein
MQLTSSSDKLPALSGLAKHFRGYVPNSTYVSGLWSESLLEDLSWTRGRAKNGTIYTKPRKRRARSWSWAAIDGDVAYWVPFEGVHSNLDVMHSDFFKVHNDGKPTVIARYAQVHTDKLRMIEEETSLSTFG